MTAQFQMKTLVRLFLVVVVACIVSTLLVGPQADAASDGYGVTAMASSSGLALTEGRSAFTMPELR